MESGVILTGPLVVSKSMSDPKKSDQISDCDYQFPGIICSPWMTSHGFNDFCSVIMQVGVWQYWVNLSAQGCLDNIKWIIQCLPFSFWLYVVVLFKHEKIRALVSGRWINPPVLICRLNLSLSLLALYFVLKPRLIVITFWLVRNQMCM